MYAENELLIKEIALALQLLYQTTTHNTALLLGESTILRIDVAGDYPFNL